MKVLILTPDIYTRGGIARYTWTLASALGDLIGPDNVQVLPLLGTRGSQETPKGFLILDIVTERLTPVAKLRFAGKALKQARHKYDLIVCSHLSLALVAATIRFVYRTPFWVVCHGSEAWGPLPLLKRVALRQADLLLPVSRFTAEKIVEVHRISQRKMSLLHNAIPDDLERLLAPPSRSAAPDAVVRNTEHLLLSVGSLAKAHAYKGFDTVIQALPTALKRVPNLRYVIVGNGDDRPRLEKLAAEHQLESHITFAGLVSDEQLAQYYRSCDVFALPSKAMARNGSWDGEGFGRVYVEAALAGKPVVGSLGGGAAEAILHGKTGLLVEPSSAEQTAAAIIQLLENPKMATEMGGAGRNWAMRNFTEEALQRSLGILLHAHGLAEL